MMDIFFTLLGLIGAALVVSMYFLLERQKVNPNSLKYYFLNGFGGLFIFISIAVDFDPTDLGGMAIEGCWVIISLMGIYRVVKKEKKND